MKSFLVGYTGFVGSNIANSHKFDGLFNSKNIEEAFLKSPDLLVYSGVRAEMFLANSNPDADLELIKNAIENIKKINPKRLVLISTVAVYDKISEGDEDTVIDKSKLPAYGKNRLYLEEWVRSDFEDFLIVRLPALYGQNLKKNFIYDYIHFIPKLLKQEKYVQLYSQDKSIASYYFLQDNGFYKCRDLTNDERVKLIDYFKKAGFSALNFTDSRNVYQFFNLELLWNLITSALSKKIRLLNVVTEPVSVKELYRYLENSEFDNEISENVLQYNLKTKYADILEGNNGYLLNKDFLLQDIKRYVIDECTALNGGLK